MSNPSLIWDETAAFAALVDWMTATFGPGGLSSLPEVQASAITQARQNTPIRVTPSISMLPVTDIPVARGYGTDVVTAPQAQKVRLEIRSASAGSYTVLIRDDDGVVSPATYVADGLDTITTIRDGLLAAVLATPNVTLSDTLDGPGSFELEGEVGHSFGGQVSDGDIDREMVDDSRRSATVRDAFWVVRFRFDDLQPDSDSPSISAARAQATEAFLDADVPVVTGVPVYLNDKLRAGNLAYNTVVGRTNLSFQRNGLWVMRTGLDVQFTTRVGLAVDTPSIDTLGYTAIQVGSN